MTAADLVDVDRYPIDDPSAPATVDLVARARADLANDGICSIEGFLRPAGLAACRSDALAIEGAAHRSGGLGTAYLERPDPAWPDGHPRARRQPYALGAVPYDRFPDDSPIRALYEWDPLLAFLGQVLRADLHRYADPLGALNLATMADGDELQWHYDQTDFVVSLALRSSTDGGYFEVFPQLRAEGDERYDIVARVLDGDRAGLVTVPMRAGTLLVFAGRHSLHRVSPVVGAPSRLVVLMGYDTAPGTRSTPELQLARYGRTAQ